MARAGIVVPFSCTAARPFSKPVKHHFLKPITKYSYVLQSAAARMKKIRMKKITIL